MLALAAASARAGIQPGGYGPVWSPDGSEIAYIGPSRALNHVIVVSADGSGMRHAVASARAGEALDEVRWADGGRFVYQDTNYTLFTSTGGPRRAAKLAEVGVTGGMGEASTLSPDGREVAFTAPCDCDVAQGTAVGIVAAAGGPPTIFPRPRGVLDAEPSFSPDGTHVVFTRYRPGRPQSIVVAGADGHGVRRLGVVGSWPAYAPSGRWIAFLRPLVGLQLVPVTGGVPRTLVRFHYVEGTASFSWSPDSSRLSFVTSARAGIVTLAGRTTTFALPGLRPDVFTPQWSPDGSSIAFSAIAKGDDRDVRVYVVGADGRGLRRIA